jgi:hypothetical protein
MTEEALKNLAYKVTQLRRTMFGSPHSEETTKRITVELLDQIQGMIADAQKAESVK